MNGSHEFLLLGKYFNSQINKNAEDMFELGLSDVLTIAQTIGITGTMVLTLYFSKRQIRSLSLDVETKVLNDLGEKIHRMGEMIIERPELGRVITNIQADRWSRTTIRILRPVHMFPRL
jgi:hypothetical protein